MIKVDIKLMDGSMLHDVLLFKSKNLIESKVTTKEEAEKLLGAEDNKNIYFCGKYVQGVFIPKQIMEFHIKEDSASVENRIKEFVKNNNTIFDTNDTAEYIIEYREQLLELLK